MHQTNRTQLVATEDDFPGQKELISHGLIGPALGKCGMQTFDHVLPIGPMAVQRWEPTICRQNPELAVNVVQPMTEVRK